MDLPATQAFDDEDLVPTQQLAAGDRGQEQALVGTLLINSTNVQHSIFPGVTVIGRQPDCNVVLDDETVSKRHAEIEAESADKAVFIRDLISSNKTKINDTKLRPEASYQVKDNDKLTFGKITATFKIHRALDDSLVSGTPQVTRNRAVIPDTPDTSMNNSSALEGDVSTIPGTQADENDSCFRRPQIPVRTSISNEQESPKRVPFMLDDVPSPLSNSKDKESDISEIETQRFTENNISEVETQKFTENNITEVETQKFTENNTKEMADRSIYTDETQKVVIPRNSNDYSHDSEEKRKLNNSSVKQILSNEFENEPLEDVETQAFACTKSDSSSRRSENTSIYSAETQKVLPDALENQSMENLETQPFNQSKSSVDKGNLADVSIHSAATQKVETASENELIENLDTQPFTRKSLSLSKRKSVNTSIYSAETQKLVADVSNQSLDNIETQRFVRASDCLKEKLADVSIYSAATQKIEPTAENGAIENLETQEFDKKRVSLNSNSRQFVNEEKIASSLSFSIQDIDTMPFTKYEISLGEKSSNAEIQNADDVLIDPAVNATKADSDSKVHDSETKNDGGEKSDSKTEQPVPTSSRKSNKLQTRDEIDDDVEQNQKPIKETLSKSMSKSLLQTSSKFDKSKSLVESDDEEEIFSQNLIENSPFALFLDDSKNDSKEQSNVDLQKDMEHENEKTVDSECNISTKKANSSTDNEKSIKNKSAVVDNDSETDEEGNFSNHLSEENENQKLPKETGNDSETDEEGVFSNHGTEEKVEGSNSKPEGDSETDEEGVFSGCLSKGSKKIKSSSSSIIIAESESEDEADLSNSSKNKASKDSIVSGETIAKTVDDINSVSESTKKHSLKQLNEVVQQNSPVLESDDDIFNENYEENGTSTSNLDKTDDPIVEKDKLDSMPKSPITNVKSDSAKNFDEVDELAPTQIVETDMSLAPTQIVNTRRMSESEEESSKEIDELAPTQLIETQTLPMSSEDALSTPSRKLRRVRDSINDVAKEYDNMDLAPTQKLVETQECAESLAPTQKLVETQECAESMAPTQKVVDTQLCSEEMGALQFSESLGPTQIIENEANNAENEVVTSPKISPNTSKRQLEEVEITSNKKLKTAEVSQKMEVDLNSTVEQNLNEMFEGPDEKVSDSEPPIETQQLENILESSQIEENSATALDVSTSQPSPTLSNKRTNTRGKNRRSRLTLNKSLNTTNKSVVNLNDTIEKNLNDLFDDKVDSVEAPEPEPMLTQQLENVLSSSQDSNSTESKNEEEGRTLNVSRRKSRLSLSMNLNNSMLKTQQEKDKCSPNVQSIEATVATSQGSSNEKPTPTQDYPANLNDKKDDAIGEQISSENDKAIVYRRATIGFTDDLKPVSTFDRVAFLGNYSTSDSQSDADDNLKLRSPSGKKRVSLSLKSIDLNSSLSSSTSVQDVGRKKVKTPASSSKKPSAVQRRSARKRDPIVRLSKLASPLYRKYAQPVKRVMACGTIGFTPDLQPVESEELVSAASTESEDDLRAQVGLPSPKIDKAADKKDEKPPADSPVQDEKPSADSPVQDKKMPVDSPVQDEKMPVDLPVQDEKMPIDSPVEDKKQPAVSPVEEEKMSPDSPEENKSDSDDDFLKRLPDARIAGTASCPATSSQLNAASDRETDSESTKSVKIEIPSRWKYAEKRYDSISEKYETRNKRTDDSESEDDETEEIKANNLSGDSIKDDQDERSAAINKILAQIGADKPVEQRKSNRAAQNDSGKKNAGANVVTTRSRKLRKANTPPPKPAEDDTAGSEKSDTVVNSKRRKANTPPPKATEDGGAEGDKTDSVVSSSSDNESSEELCLLPTYRPVSPLRFNMKMMEGDDDDDEDSGLEFQAPHPNRKPFVSQAKAGTSPLRARRGRRKSACNNDANDVTQKRENNADNIIAAFSSVGTVDKDGLVFQVPSRDSKTTTTTSRTSGATTSRTKRIIDSDDDDESTCEPSPKRTKTLANRQRLQEATVVISPLKDKLLKLREANRLNVANVPSDFKQPDSTLEAKKVERTAKTSDARAKTARTDSSDLSAVESSIVEDTKNESRSKPKTRGRLAVARDRKAKADASSERSANSSKENVEESDVQKPKTRGRGRRNQTTDSSASDIANSQDEVSASSVESKSTRSTRGRLVHQNQTKKEEAKATKQQSKVVDDSDSEVAEEPKTTVRKNTRGRLAKNVDKAGTDKKVVADSKNDKVQDTDSSASDIANSQDEVSASSVESKSTRSTRGRLVRQNQTKKEEAKATNQQSKVVDDSDSEVAEEPKTTVRKNTRGRLAKNVDKAGTDKKDVADSKNDKVQDKASESQSSSQSESVTGRTTRTRKNKVNQESDSANSETPEVAATRGNKKRPVKDKPDLVVKVTEVDSNKETTTKSDEIKDEEESNDKVNVFKTMKKKMHLKAEEPTKPPARKTRTRGAKNATNVAESSSEESQEVSEIMKNSIVEDSKTSTTTSRRRGRAVKNISYVENTESSDDVFEKPTTRPKRARLAKADKSPSSQVSDTDEDSKPTQSSQRSTRRKHTPSPSPSPTPPSEAALTPSRSSRLSLTPTKKPKVLFTGDKSEEHRNILTKLGGVETEEFNSCSVLITDKVRRTFKFLCSLARGIPIASVKWLDDSKKANHFLDLEEYILNDPEAETKFKFNLKESLDKAKKHKLLEGYTVLLAPKIKQPPVAELKEMVISSGGKPLVRAPAKWPAKCVVVTTEQELDSAKKLIAKAPKSVTIHSLEFILTGILRQEANFNEFKLLG